MSEKFIEVTVTIKSRVSLSELRQFDWAKDYTDEELLKQDIDFADDFIHEWLDRDDLSYQTIGKITEEEE
jgi:hypothetical protein